MEVRPVSPPGLDDPPAPQSDVLEPGELPVLWHIKVSNFNEKARWALDYKGIRHIRRNPLPGAHMLVALVLTRRVATFPVLELDGRAIGDTTRIIAALE